MKNKLSLLGLLGLLGFLGFGGEPVLFAFFCNFVFFTYAKVIPDELFWNNVRVAASRAFFIFLALSNIVVAVGVMFAKQSMANIASLIITGFALIMVVCELVFILGLGWQEGEEKRGKDEN